MAKPKVRTEFPRKVREIENTWIEMPDGIKLAARIWLPEDAEADPVPAILEYLPYRKRDGTAERDHLTHPYFAGFGYAGVRVDMRGTGDSEGLCLGEYLQQEQDDCLAVIEWLAAQPWCSGRVGMIGISWGGFNGLQVAARRPRALGAVVSICSTDDRYADDIHFMGGAVLTEKLTWGATALSIAMTPPDEAVVGERWREMWRDRLEGNGAWLIDWFRHQRRDDFWKHGSVCEDFSDIEVPVYAVGGWADAYTNAVFRLVENLPGQCKGLIGPWAHKYPHFAEPGPQIGFLQECLRWWDQHLKGIDTGIMDEPSLRAWMQDPALPEPYFAERPGRWIAEDGWPVDRGQTTFVLGDGTLSEKAEGAVFEIASPQNAGKATPHFLSFGLIADLNIDQREDEGRVVVFETEPLDQDVEVLGFPTLEVEVSSTTPVASLSAVLSAVDADGPVSPVSFGVLNLTHRNSHEFPEPLIPGKAEVIRMQLNACGQRFAAGERIRLALSSSFWPMIWPSPEASTLTVRAGAKLHLPVRPPQERDAELPEFEPAEGAKPIDEETIQPGGYWRYHETDQVLGVECYKRIMDSGVVRHAHTDLTLRNLNTDTYLIHPDDPNSARVTSDWLKTYARGNWQAEVETSSTIAALGDVWQIEVTVIARENGEEVFRKTYAEDVPRDLV